MHMQHSAEANNSRIQMQGRVKNYRKIHASFKFLSFVHLLLDIVEAINGEALLSRKMEYNFLSSGLTYHIVCST